MYMAPWVASWHIHGAIYMVPYIFPWPDWDVYGTLSSESSTMSSALPYTRCRMHRLDLVDKVPWQGAIYIDLDLIAAFHWKEISEIDIGDWDSMTLRLNKLYQIQVILYLNCHVPLKRDQWDWHCRLRFNDTPNAVSCTKSKSFYKLQCVAVCCSVLQCVAVCCNDA